MKTRIFHTFIIKRLKLKSKLFEKYGEKCFYCDIPLDLYSMVVEHFIPRKLGGKSKMSNYRPACHSCNSYKGILTIKEWELVLKHHIISKRIKYIRDRGRFQVILSKITKL